MYCSDTKVLIPNPFLDWHRLEKCTFQSGSVENLDDLTNNDDSSFQASWSFLRRKLLNHGYYAFELNAELQTFLAKGAVGVEHIDQSVSSNIVRGKLRSFCVFS